MSEENWVWMPHPAHFIAGKRCAFHLATYVPSGYIISTVGEYMPPGYKHGDDFGTVGLNRKYETMVWKAEESNIECCPYRARIKEGCVDFRGYNDPEEARKGHIELCKKWARKEKEKEETEKNILKMKGLGPAEGVLKKFKEMTEKIDKFEVVEFLPDEKVLKIKKK